MQLTAQQALENLYKAARTVSASAEIHEAFRQSYELLKAEIEPESEA